MFRHDGIDARHQRLEIWDLRSGKAQSENAVRRYEEMLRVAAPDPHAAYRPANLAGTLQINLAGLTLAHARATYGADTLLRVYSADDKPVATIFHTNEISVGAFSNEEEAFTELGSSTAGTYVLALEVMAAP